MRQLQHTTPIIVTPSLDDATPLTSLDRSATVSVGGYDEQFIQRLLFQNPAALPIAEIDESFASPIPVCMELETPAGPIDAFFINELGLPTLMECKLWRNPQARREVIGQILDYAKELARWSYEDLQREVSRSLKRRGNALWEIVSSAYPNLDEAKFVDAVTRNLRTGRFLLIIAGDGIREGVEAITEYVSLHAGMQFTFGLVETPVYQLPSGEHIVTPRILAKTVIINRYVVDFGDANASLRDASLQEDERDTDPPEEHPNFRYWQAFLSKLTLDDPTQPVPKPTKAGHLAFMLPTPGGNNWLTVYKSVTDGAVGVFTAGTRDTIGTEVLAALAKDKDDILEQLGPDASFGIAEGGKPKFIAKRPGYDPNRPDGFDEQHAWLAQTINTFVNVIRPRVETILGEMDT